MGLIQTLFRAFRIVVARRRVPSAKLGPETRRLFCVSRKYALKRLQERSWASASGVEQRAMLAIRLIPLMKASSSPRYQSSNCAGWCCASTAREKGDPWGSCWNWLSAFTGAISSGDCPSSKGDKSLSFHISSSTTATQFLFLFPVCLYFALCFFSCVFFCNADSHIFPFTRILIGPRVPVASCPLRHASSFLLPWKVSGIRNLFSGVMHSMCNFVPFLSDCLCHTYLSNHFSPTNNTFSCSSYAHQFMLLPTLPKKFLLLLLCWQWSTAISGVILVLLLTKRTLSILLSVTGSLFSCFFGVETGVSYPHG